MGVNRHKDPAVLQSLNIQFHDSLRTLQHLVNYNITLHIFSVKKASDIPRSDFSYDNAELLKTKLNDSVLIEK
jgi:hypothetical protein